MHTMQVIILYPQLVCTTLPVVHCCKISVAEAYDEGYINMAPSGATAKPLAHSGRNGNCKFGTSTCIIIMSIACTCVQYLCPPVWIYLWWVRVQTTPIIIMIGFLRIEIAKEIIFMMKLIYGVPECCQLLEEDKPQILVWMSDCMMTL